ncbi:hypothetical protein HID58_087056 [Brassica napus]|uniref:Uncharacterized protein n=1 Tax=Brassica napus TaxID=3708 RepID=A0ABQ7XV56_BRANA|nr:hypothetical protein HID58_087056 [Brassica napus]
MAWVQGVEKAVNGDEPLNPEMKGRKRKNPSTTSVGISSRTRARKAVSYGNEPARETTVVSLSVDSESEDMSVVSSKVINSVLVPTVGEEIMLARIINEEPEYHYVAARVFEKKKDKEKVTFLEDSSSNSGLESLKAPEERILGAMSEGFSGLKLVVETKLGDMDVRMSKFEKNQRQLRRRAKKIEERLTSIESKKNEERNYGEDMDFGQWDDKDYGRAEGKENSEKAKEEKGNTESGEEKDVVSGEENSKDGEKDKGNVEDDMEQDDEEEEQVVVEKRTESSEEEKENEADKTELGTREEDEVSEEDYDTEEEAAKRRIKADAVWRRILSESDEDVAEKKEVEGKEVQEEVENLEKEAEKVSKGTPTPPRGRPKRLAARKIVLTPPEEFLRGPAVTEPSPIETEKEAEEMAVEADVEEEEEKPEESDEESPTEKNAEEMVEEEEAIEESPTEENVKKMVEEEVVEEETMEEEAVEAEKAEQEADKVASEEMADGTNEVRRDGTNEVTAKKRRIPSNESALVIAYTPREKRKPQWLQSPYTQMKTEDIDRPKKKRKTKAK